MVDCMALPAWSAFMVAARRAVLCAQWKCCGLWRSGACSVAAAVVAACSGPLATLRRRWLQGSLHNLCDTGVDLLLFGAGAARIVRHRYSLWCDHLLLGLL